MKHEKVHLIIRIVALLGLVLSSYLLYQQFFRSSFEPCYVNSLVNCDAIISGPVKYTFGIPTPLYGFIGYIVILVASFTKKIKLLLSMALFGLFFCLGIAYKEIVILKVICPLCIACQSIMIILSTLGIVLIKKKEK